MQPLLAEQHVREDSSKTGIKLTKPDANTEDLFPGLVGMAYFIDILFDLSERSNRLGTFCISQILSPWNLRQQYEK